MLGAGWADSEYSCTALLDEELVLTERQDRWVVSISPLHILILLSRVGSTELDRCNRCQDVNIHQWRFEIMSESLWCGRLFTFKGAKLPIKPKSFFFLPPFIALIHSKATYCVNVLQLNSSALDRNIKSRQSPNWRRKAATASFFLSHIPLIVCPEQWRHLSPWPHSYIIAHTHARATYT